MAEKTIEIDFDGYGVRDSISDIAQFPFPVAVEYTKYGTIKFTYTDKFDVKRILKSGDYTHVFWRDGSKTTVKRQEGAVDNPYSAFTAALAIKIYGNNSAVNCLIDRTYEEQYRDPDTGKMKKCNTPEDRKKLRKYMKERMKREQESD